MHAQMAGGTHAAASIEGQNHLIIIRRRCFIAAAVAPAAPAASRLQIHTSKAMEGHKHTEQNKSAKSVSFSLPHAQSTKPNSPSPFTRTGSKPPNKNPTEK
jgi:hypothetical protein